MSRGRNSKFGRYCTLTTRSQLSPDALGDALTEGGNADIVQSINLSRKEIRMPGQGGEEPVQPKRMNSGCAAEEADEAVPN
jgi:hypothetical protein